MDVSELKEELDHLRKLRRTYKKRLWVREEQKAFHGIDCPPHILMEIAELNEEIARIDMRIVDVEVKLQAFAMEVSIHATVIAQLSNESVLKIAEQLDDLRKRVDYILSQLGLLK